MAFFDLPTMVRDFADLRGNLAVLVFVAVLVPIVVRAEGNEGMLWWLCIVAKFLRIYKL